MVFNVFTGVTKRLRLDSSTVFPRLVSNYSFLKVKNVEITALW
jgi:hypothetical protein